MTSRKISGIRVSVEHAHGASIHTHFFLFLGNSLSPLVVLISQNIPVQHAVIFFFSCYVSSFCTSTSAHQPTHIHAVCPMDFHPHARVCSDIRCICYASPLLDIEENCIYNKLIMFNQKKKIHFWQQGSERKCI